MPSFSLIIPLLVALLAVGAYFLGLTDRPPFVTKTNGPNYYAIVAVTNTKDIGGNIMRLLESTVQGIRQQSDINKELLVQAAQKYGAPDGADMLSLGLYLDNPAVTAHPRWAAGYLIDASSWEHAQSIASQISDLPEPVRAVRIVQTSTIQARIPWRTMLTPMIAPRLHWSRAVQVYQRENHASYCGRHTSSFDPSFPCALPMEFYVTGPNGSRGWIDYVMLTGDTTLTLDDLYPTTTTTSDAREAKEGNEGDVATEEGDAHDETPTTAESVQNHDEEEHDPDHGEGEEHDHEDNPHEDEEEEEEEEFHHHEEEQEEHDEEEDSEHFEEDEHEEEGEDMEHGEPEDGEAAHEEGEHEEEIHEETATA